MMEDERDSERVSKAGREGWRREKDIERSSSGWKGQRDKG